MFNSFIFLTIILLLIFNWKNSVKACYPGTLYPSTNACCSPSLSTCTNPCPQTYIFLLFKNLIQKKNFILDKMHQNFYHLSVHTANMKDHMNELLIILMLVTIYIIKVMEIMAVIIIIIIMAMKQIIIIV